MKNLETVVMRAVNSFMGNPPFWEFFMVLREALRKKIRDYLGIFSKWQTPPFWEPLVQKKNYGLFCVLGPEEHFWFLQKKSLFVKEKIPK